MYNISLLNVMIPNITYQIFVKINFRIRIFISNIDYSMIKKAISEFPNRPPARYAPVFEQWNAVSYSTEFSRDLLRNIKVPHSQVNEV